MITQDKKHYVKEVSLTPQYQLDKYDDKQKMDIMKLAGTNDWYEVDRVNEIIIPN